MYFNPLPSCEGRQSASAPSPAHENISIHSPHARGDSKALHLQPPLKYFNPLPSCEGRPPRRSRCRLCPSDFNPLPSCEGRLRARCRCRRPTAFQSTPLMRGETGGAERDGESAAHFNPLPSCEGRPAKYEPDKAKIKISIHSPHARGDFLALLAALKLLSFQSTPLMRGETA